jgi:hypothetical protein
MGATAVQRRESLRCAIPREIGVRVQGFGVVVREAGDSEPFFRKSTIQ